jgi:hypothetical protein
MLTTDLEVEQPTLAGHFLTGGRKNCRLASAI